ncbi:MAG: glycosyltransferase family 4 protein [Chloroflexota bacterium]
MNNQSKGLQKEDIRLSFIGMKGLPPDRPGAGGGERETDAKTRRLAERGYDVTVYCRNNYYPDPPTEYEGVKLVSLPAFGRPGIEMLTHTLFSTLHALVNRSADVISYHGMGNALYVPLLKLLGKRSVVYMDGVDWERPKWGKLASRLLKLGATFAFKWADEVYVDNEASQKRFGEIFGRTPQMITLAADLWEPPGTDLLPDLGIEPDNYILFVGMLKPDKGVHLLIEAYSKLKTDIPLVIVGDNPDHPEYVQKLKRLSDDRVKFLGFQYGMAARQIFANCLIYVQPSVMEGNSPALMSAMACGRCVVVNGIEQNRETIGDSGIAFSAGNTDDLCHQLEMLLNDKPLIKQYGEKAYQRIHDVYNWERVVDELEQLYAEVLDNRKEVA